MQLSSDAFDHEHDHEVHIPDDGDLEGKPRSIVGRLLPESTRKWLAKLWAYTGPGWLMSIAYLDPGNLTSDLQSGVVGGYGLLWVLFWSTVFGLILQVMAARLGVVTGRGLADICRTHYSFAPRIALWLCTEIAVLCADIQEVVGSAIALNILSGLPLWIGVLLTGLDTFFVLLIEKAGVRKLEMVFAFLIVILALSFFLVFFYSGPEWGKLLKGTIIPIVPFGSVEQAVGTLGAVIMPHNLFLHSCLVQSRDVNRMKKEKVDEALYFNTVESSMSLFTSFLINMAVVGVFAQQFFPGSRTCSGNNCNSVIGLENAGQALGGALKGDWSRIIWALGVLSAGQSSTLTGTYAGQFIMTGFLGLKQLSAWRRALLTRSIALVPATMVALLTHGFFDTLNEWLNVVQSVQLPFALLPLLQATSSKQIMGPYRNNRFWQWSGWGLATVVIVTNFYLVGSQLASSLSAWWQFVLVAMFSMVYLGFCAYLFKTKLGDDLPGETRLSLLAEGGSGHTERSWWMEAETPASTA